MERGQENQKLGPGLSSYSILLLMSCASHKVENRLQTAASEADLPRADGRTDVSGHDH